MQRRHLFDAIAEEFPDFTSFTSYSREELLELDTFLYSEFARWLNEDFLADEKRCQENATSIPKLAALLSDYEEHPQQYLESSLTNLLENFFFMVDAVPLQALIPFLSAKTLHEVKKYYRRTGFCPIPHGEIDEFFTRALWS